MKIELHSIPVRDLYNGYVNSAENGVFGYGGRLDIRPPYQREFVYKPEQQQAVIDTVLKGFPLNVMYWVRIPEDRYEVMDGQQRTLSICEYIAGHFAINDEGNKKFFINLPKDKQKKILDYELMVYFCEGEASEKLEWFKTVNIAGEKLTNQEMLNAVYAGPWCSDAKKHFSKSGCAAKKLSDKYVKGSPIRQELLETALKWITNGDPESYMSEHQYDPNANELWMYFQNVINWVQLTIPKYRREMKGVNWGALYNEYHDKMFDAAKLEDEITRLMADEDVSNKPGIYKYIFTGKERDLSIRAFDNRDKRTAYERQKGKCAKCGKKCEIEEMEADHITPWSKGGKTIPENCQMLCRDCNRTKSDV